ncbi:MAG: hypothetical protein NTZ09_10315 [Candidatus Hydrogenedentes bacterium]|nr:hypothetical protein [Candidatus Hydrogenedentota bacterium]
MFFFLMLLMSVAGIVIWALLLGIAWRSMLALEALARTQREVVSVMQKRPAPTVEEPGRVLVET